FVRSQRSTNSSFDGSARSSFARSCASELRLRAKPGLQIYCEMESAAQASLASKRLRVEHWISHEQAFGGQGGSTPLARAYAAETLPLGCEHYRQSPVWRTRVPGSRQALL